MDIGIAYQRINKRMDGTAEFQIPAQADGEVAQGALQGADGEQVRQCLGRVLMAAVAGIDDRNG